MGKRKGKRGRCEQGDGIDPSLIGIGAKRRADFEAEKAKREAGG